MNSATRQLQKLLAAVGDPSRFRIVLELARRERHVSDLADTIALSQSCTTRHLQALSRAGVVRTRRDGKRVMAALALQTREVAGLVQWLRAGSALASYPSPGRTGGTDARRRTQDAPPRQVLRASRRHEGGAAAAGARRRRAADGPRTAGGVPVPAVLVPASGVAPVNAPNAIAQERPHAVPPGSDTPPSASPARAVPAPRRRDDIDDFLL